MKNSIAKYSLIEFIEAEKKSLLQIIDGDRGVNYPNKTEMAQNGYCLFLNTSNIKDDNFDLSSGDYITLEKDLKLRKGKLIRKDIVLTTRGTVGSVAHYKKTIKPEHLRINSGMVILRVSHNLDDNYFYQVVKSDFLKRQFYLFGSGSAQPQLPIKDLRRISFPYPPHPIQRKIAAVLSAYDDLIENNNRRIAILEKMAEELYREWFVRLRFPGHEKTKITKGIPEGWEMRRIGEICIKVTDGAHASPSFVNDGKFMASVKDMTDYGFNLESMKTIGESDFVKLVHADCKPLADDVLIAKDGSYLKHVFVWNRNLDLVILSSIAILRPNKDLIQPHFFSLTLKQESIKSMMASYVSGSALPRIILNDFKKMQLLVPERSLIIQFESIVKPIYQNINAILDSISYLTNSRDRLLSRLMSGKINVEHLDIAFPKSMINEADAEQAAELQRGVVKAPASMKEEKTAHA